jgi:putative transposase
MLAGISTRGWQRGWNRSANRSNGLRLARVGRHFVKATETALVELLARGLDDLDLVASMLDRVHPVCIVGLGIGIDGIKHLLAVVEATPRTPRWS